MDATDKIRLVGTVHEGQTWRHRKTGRQCVVGPLPVVPMQWWRWFTLIHDKRTTLKDAMDFVRDYERVESGT